MLFNIRRVSCKEIEESEQVHIDDSICKCVKGFVSYDYYDPKEAGLTGMDSIDLEEPVAKLFLKLESDMRDLLLAGYPKKLEDNVFFASLEETTGD